MNLIRKGEIYSQRCNFSTWRFRWKLRLKHFPQDGHWIHERGSKMQCCGSGSKSGSVCFVPPGSGFVSYKQCCGSGSGIRCLFDPWVRDPGWVKSKDPRSGSGMNNQDHISESLETIFFGWNIPDPQHWLQVRIRIRILRSSGSVCFEPLGSISGSVRQR